MSKTTKPTPKATAEQAKEQAKPVLSIIKDIQRQSRKQYSAEEKIRIVLEGLQGEVWGGSIWRDKILAK